MTERGHPDSNGNQHEIIEFQLHHHDASGAAATVHYGINVCHVREIIKVPATTNYPNSHPSVLGIFNLREHIIPLIDLARFLRARTDSPLEQKRVIVTQFQDKFHGFLVDNVNRIYQIDSSSMESTESISQSYARDCVQSVVRMKDRLILMLDFQKIIANNDFAAEAGNF